MCDTESTIENPVWFWLNQTLQVKSMKHTAIDKQWDELMDLCRKESEFQESGRHPKTAKLVSSRIDELATEMGFTAQQIEKREFRALRDGSHIVRIATP